MPAYHLIIHTYGSWLPDQSTGYHTRKSKIRLARNEGLAEYYSARMTSSAIQFSKRQQSLLLKLCRKIPQKNAYKVHAAAIVSNHIHVVVSWRSDETVSAIKARLKLRFVHALNAQLDHPPARWFSRGTGTVKIHDMDHLIELVRRYFPGHGEFVWIADQVMRRYRESL